MKKTMALTLAALAAAELFAFQGTVSTETDSFTGDVKWNARDKKYVIEKGKISKEFPLADVTNIEIAKPATFDAAVKMVQDGKAAAPDLRVRILGRSHYTFYSLFNQPLSAGRCFSGMTARL